MITRSSVKWITLRDSSKVMQCIVCVAVYQTRNIVGITLPDFLTVASWDRLTLIIAITGKLILGRLRLHWTKQNQSTTWDYPVAKVIVLQIYIYKLLLKGYDQHPAVVLLEKDELITDCDYMLSILKAFKRFEYKINVKV